MNPTISVLIATYNRPAILGECFTSLSRQTFKDFDVWVVNDAGTKVDSVAAQFSSLNLHVLNTRKNSGPGGARNLALRETRGEFIALCDDDDLFLPTHLEGLIQKIPGFDLVHSDAEIVVVKSENGRRIAVSRTPFALEMTPELLAFTNPVIPSTVLYRRKWHDECGGFDESIYHHWEWDWWLRISKEGKIGRVPKATSLYAWDGGNISGAHEKMAQSLETLCRKHTLGSLPTWNFYLMTQDEKLFPWRRETEIIWDDSEEKSPLPGFRPPKG